MTSQEINVSQIERIVSLAVGGSLVTLGFLGRRRRIGAAAAVAAGLALAWRGASGHCQIFEMLGLSTAEDDDETTSPASRTTPEDRIDHDLDREADWREDHDLVQEASEESFPASDPPSFTPGKIGG